MKIIWHIAADSIRSLLHQRLLLGLMLATLALTIFFSITMSVTRKNINARYIDETVTNSVTATNGVSAAGQGNIPPAATNGMSEADQRQFRESMESASSSIQAMFYQVGSFGGSLVALFIFSTAVAGEIRKGTIRLTLSKPVSRTQFLLGKYLGGVVVMAGYALISSAAILLFAQTQKLELGEAIQWAPWLMFCRQLMLGSLAMLLSLFMHPMIASVFAFIAGNGLYSPPNPLYFILPSYKDFNVFFQVLQGSLMHLKDVAFLSLYAVDFVAIMLLLALWRFRAKELV
jgi:ABC-type transport system involved in multi-copper enzyme maturation permease subunit